MKHPKIDLSDPRLGSQLLKEPRGLLPLHVWVNYIYNHGGASSRILEWSDASDVDGGPIEPKRAMNEAKDLVKQSMGSLMKGSEKEALDTAGLAWWILTRGLSSYERKRGHPVRMRPLAIRAFVIRKFNPDSPQVGGYAACLLVIVSFGSFTFTSHNTFMQVGSGLTVAAGLYMAYQLYERRNRGLPSETQPSACTTFYRRELERQRDFHRGSWFWSRLVTMIPGYVLFLIGFARANPGSAWVMVLIGVCFLGLCVVAVPLNLRLSRKYQRQLDELDSPPKKPQ